MDNSSSVVRALHQHRKGLGSIPSRSESNILMNFPNYSSLDFRHVYDVSVIRHIYSLEIIQHLKRTCSLEGSGFDKNTKRP